MAAKVDICVLAHNRWDVTQRFLPHLIQTTAGIPYALHLLDNGSDEKGDRNWRLMRILRARARARFWYPGLRVTAERSEKNLNFAGGNNRLAAKGTAPWILFLNNDAFPDDRYWLAKLVMAAENGGFEAAGPVSDYVMGFQHRLLNGRLPDVHHTHVLSGFCFLVSRRAFEAVRGWDEQFDNGDEDIDLSMAVRRWAWIAHKNPAALCVNRRVFVHHEGSQSLGPWCEKRGETVAKHFTKTHEKLVAKRGERVLLDAFYIEDAKHPPSKWRELGVLPDGTYYQQPSTCCDTARAIHGIERDPARSGGTENQGDPHRQGGGTPHRAGSELPSQNGTGGKAEGIRAPGGGAGRRTRSETPGRGRGDDPAHEQQGIQEVRQADAGRIRPGARRGTDTGAAVLGTHPATGLRWHFGSTRDGGFVARAVAFGTGGGECCYGRVDSVLACSCGFERVA